MLELYHKSKTQTMIETDVPLDCPVDNPYVRTRVLPDIALADQLTTTEQTIDFLPDQSGALEILAQISGEYSRYKEQGDTEPIIDFLGCKACKLAGVCPIPVAIERGAERTTNLIQLEGIITASEEGDPISRVWLETSAKNIKDTDHKVSDESVTFKMLDKVAEQNAHVEEMANGTRVFVVNDGPSERGKHERDIAIIDTTGDITDITSENDRGSRVIKAELSNLFEMIKNDGIKASLKNFNSAAVDCKTQDGKIIYKSRDNGPGGYRMFFSIEYDEDRTWLLISGATHHDNQEYYLLHGEPAAINVSNYVEGLKHPDTSATRED